MPDKEVLRLARDLLLRRQPGELRVRIRRAVRVQRARDAPRERVARQLQDSGSRLEGALLPELGDDATAATAAELRELCRRLQCEADSLELVAASSAIRDAASHLGVARVHAATADAPFPHLGMA